jgi:hypothetical protein
MPSSSHVTDGSRCIQMREKQRDPAEHNNELTIGQFDAFFPTAAHKKGPQITQLRAEERPFFRCKVEQPRTRRRWVRES